MEKQINSTQAGLTLSTKSYKVINLIDERPETIQANPLSPICSKENKEPIRRLFELMALSAKKNELKMNERILNYIAFENNNVTVDEAFTGFWKAMADPYVPNATGIEVRHIMRYVTEAREATENKEKLYTYNQVLSEKDKGIPMAEFEITEKLDKAGKPYWRRNADK